MAMIALAWHLGLFWLDRSLTKRPRRPLSELLLQAELDLLKALQAELKRAISRNPNPSYGRKLREVNERLEGLSG